MLLKFASGATGYLSTVFVTARALPRARLRHRRAGSSCAATPSSPCAASRAQPEKITLPAVDKEKAELEAFADAVEAKKPFVVPAEEAVNGVAVLEAIVASAAKGKPVQIK